MMNKINTIIIDDEPKSLNRLKILLNKFDEINLLEIFEVAEDGLQFIFNNEPELAFVDIEMTKLSGLELAKEVNKQLLKTKIIFFTAHPHYSLDAIKLPVFDYLLKPVSIEELKETINRFNTKHKTILSEKEIKIIREISNGLNSKEIGNKLFLSKHTTPSFNILSMDVKSSLRYFLI